MPELSGSAQIRELVAMLSTHDTVELHGGVVVGETCVVAEEVRNEILERLEQMKTSHPLSNHHAFIVGVELAQAEVRRTGEVDQS